MAHGPPDPVFEAPWRLVLRRLRIPVALAIALIAFATLFYTYIEGFGVVDAFYMTVITLSTVGFGEVKPLDTSARIFTIALIAVGFGVIAYSAAIIGDLFLSGDLGRAMAARRRRRLTSRLHDHVLVVGFGRVGQAVARELSDQGETVLVLDNNEARADDVAALGVEVAVGDGTNEAALVESGIERAKALVVSAQDDPTNLVVVLTARTLVPDLRIISRVGYPQWRKRILSAGADVALSPYDTVGKSIAATAISPEILDLHDLPLLGLRNEEIVVAENSPLIGRTVEDVGGEYPSVLLLAVRRDERTHLYEDIDSVIAAGDVIVVLGPSGELAKLAREVSAP